MSWAAKNWIPPWDCSAIEDQDQDRDREDGRCPSATNVELAKPREQEGQEPGDRRRPWARGRRGAFGGRIAQSGATIARVR